MFSTTRIKQILVIIYKYYDLLVKNKRKYTEFQQKGVP